jgi:hypothetical protein
MHSISRVCHTLPNSPMASKTCCKWRSAFAKRSTLARDMMRSLGTTKRGSASIPCISRAAITVEPLSSNPGNGPTFTLLNFTPWKVAHVGSASIGSFSHPSCLPLLIMFKRGSHRRTKKESGLECHAMGAAARTRRCVCVVLSLAWDPAAGFLRLQRLHWTL